MSVIPTLDSLRFDALGPILEARDSEVEIKNIYRVLQVLRPLIDVGDLLKADLLNAAGTGRTWNNVEHTRQIDLKPVAITGGSIVWLSGTTGASLSKVATGTPPTQSSHYAGRIPNKWKAGSTVTLFWRFYNVDAQTGTNSVAWRIQSNSPASSGVVSAVDTGAVTTTLAANQAANTVIETSITLSNVAVDDLMDVTLSTNNTGTTATGNIVILDSPWIEIVQAGVPDSGVAG